MDENSVSGDVNIVLRTYHPESDEGFIYSTWRNSSYYGSGVHQGGADKFFKKQTAKIKQILKDALIFIACLEDDPMTIIGYSVTTGTHLDWIYVKPGEDDCFRKKGIATMLMPKTIQTVTHQLTKIGREIVIKKNLKTKENT